MTIHRLILAVLGFTFLPAARAAAQTVPLEVRSMDENFVLREVVGQTRTRVWTAYGYANGYSETTVPLCASPCRLEATPGYHVVEIVANGMVHGNYSFNLNGPSTLVAQRHSRRGRRITRIVTSIGIAVAGGLAMAHGFRLPRDDGQYSGKSAIWLSAGGVVAVIGLSLIPSARRFSDWWSVTVTPE